MNLPPHRSRPTIPEYGQPPEGDPWPVERIDRCIDSAEKAVARLEKVDMLSPQLKAMYFALIAELESDRAGFIDANHFR